MKKIYIKRLSLVQNWYQKRKEEKKMHVQHTCDMDKNGKKIVLEKKKNNF